MPIEKKKKAILITLALLAVAGIASAIAIPLVIKKRKEEEEVENKKEENKTIIPAGAKNIRSEFGYIGFSESGALSCNTTSNVTEKGTPVKSVTWLMKFTDNTAPDYCALQTSSLGGYLTCNSVGEVSLVSTSTITDAQLWQIVPIGPNYALRSKNSQTYLSAQKGGALKATATAAQGWEQFSILSIVS